MAWAAVAGAAVSVIGGAMASDGGGGGGGAAQSNAQAERLSGVQADIAEQQWERWKSIYEPMEMEFVNESRGVGSIANQNKAAQQAAGDVAAGFAGAREQLAETPGLNPNSDAYLRTASRVNLAEAATSAAAQNGARQNVQDKGRAAVTDAVSLGKGMPASASSMLSSAGAGFNSAANFAQRQAMYDQQQQNAGMAGIGRAAGGLVGSKGFQDWMNRGSTPVDNYNTWQSSPMQEQIYSNGSLGD